MGKPKTNHDAAQEYRLQGLSVFPVCWTDNSGHCLAPGLNHGVTCRHPAKTPLVRWKTFQDRLPTETEVRDWWLRWRMANIGFVTGKRSGRIVLDPDGNIGADTLRDLELELGELPPTQRVKTPNGEHLHFTHPGHGVIIRNRVSDLGDGLGERLDVRGDGGYALLPPSQNAGRPYFWEITSGPADLPLAQLPGSWLLRLTERRQLSDKQGRSALPLNHIIPEHARNSTLTSLAGTMRRRGMREREIVAALLVVNTERCSPPLTEGEVRSIAESVSRYEPKAEPGRSGSRGYAVLSDAKVADSDVVLALADELWRKL